MISRFRMFCLLFISLFRKKTDYKLGDSVNTRFWITPFDIELVRAPSYTYSTFCNIAYWNFISQGHSVGKLIWDRITPIGFQENIHFIRSMRLFQRVRVETTPIYWNYKTITIQTKFFVNEQVCAVAIHQVGLWSKNGRIKPEDAFAGLGKYRGEVPEIETQISKVTDIIEGL